MDKKWKYALSGAAGGLVNGLFGGGGGTVLVPLLTALPYLLGGLVGGFVGGKLFKKMPSAWLRRLFGVFLLYGGVRYLL